MVTTNKEREGRNKEPEWMFEARIDQNKPDPVVHERIPEQLHKLGKVFFPIPPGLKAWEYPHHMDSKRYEPLSEGLNGWLCQSWNYGIACANDLIVIDIDEPEYLHDIIDGLPHTVYQKTGSRSGYHIFYLAEGFDTRENLYSYECSDCGCETPYWDMEEEDGGGNPSYFCPDCGSQLSQEDTKVHVGEVKADPHGYVVGPGSLHPSGNCYGPLKGDELKRVDAEVIHKAISHFKIKESYTVDYSSCPDPEAHEYDNTNELYTLEAHEVLPYLEPKNRIAHPVHGSEQSDANFMLNEGRETFTCWRCQVGHSDGCGLNAAQYLAAEELGNRGIAGDYVCEDVRRRWSDDKKLHYYAWKRAVEIELISDELIPYNVLDGFARDRGWVNRGEDMGHSQKIQAMKALHYLLSEGFGILE